jgi:hypothetical protein
MRVKKCGWVAVSAGLLLCAAAAADTVLVNIPLDQQINMGQGDAIYVPAGLNGTISFQPANPPSEPDGWCRDNFIGNPGGWYYGPYVSFQLAGLGDIDCSNAKFDIDLRYYKVNGDYGDAPIFLRIYTADANGNYLGYRDFSIIYAVQQGDPHYPTWVHKTVWLNNPAANPYTEGGTFSIGTVSYMRFYGTDWNGDAGGGDFIDAKKLVITDVPPAVQADAGPDQTFPDAACSTPVTLDGSGSTGAIVRFLWKEGSYTWADYNDPNHPTADIAISSGVHTITLYVYDAANNVDSDDMVITIPAFPPTGPPVDLAMDQQVNRAITGGPQDATGGPIAFLTEGGDGFTRRYMTTFDNGANWYYYGPFVNFNEACYGPIDVTPENMFLQFTARFYKEGGYDDAPIFVGLRDSANRYAEFGLLYQTASWFPDPVEPYPVWTRVTTDMTFDSIPADFDLTQVTQVQFRGTDWGGLGNDYVDIKDLYLGVLIPPHADAGVDQVKPGTGCSPSASVTLDGSGSTPGQGTIVRYVWTYDGNVLSDGTSPSVTTTMRGAGDHYAYLKVYNDSGLYDTDDVKITIGTALPLPIDIPMDVQINNGGMGDAIYQPIDGVDPLEPYGEVAEIYVGQDIYGNPTDYTTGYMLVGGGWYHGPWVRLVYACYGTVDLSSPYMRLQFDGRYFQDANNWACDPADPNCSPQPYEDAPIFVTLRDANGKRGSLEIVYGPDMRDDPDKWPNWKHIDVPLDIKTGDFTDQGFDITKVTRIEFFGTDWGGTGWDEVDIKNLWVGEVAPAVCTGDVNCDGVIDFGDINPFVLYLSNNAGWLAAFPGCNPLNGDINCDGTYGQGEFGDINPFVSLMTQCGSGCTCPGPVVCP